MTNVLVTNTSDSGGGRASTNWGEAAGNQQRKILPLAIGTVILLVLGLPLAVWLDLRNLSEQVLRQQADDLSRVFNDVRDFYASDIVSRVLAAKEQVTASHNYRSIGAAVPIPATFSIELGRIVGRRKHAQATA